jgi:hypothetical protein
MDLVSEISKRQSLAMLRSPSQCSWLGEDRSHGLILHRLVKVKLHQGVSPPPWCTTAGDGQRLVPLYTSRGGEQGTPYSSSTIHVVLPPACIGLGNIKHKHRLIHLSGIDQPLVK